MIKVAFNARIGKDGAKIIPTKNGGFITMDVAVETFVQGEKKPMWVRVKAFDEKLQKKVPFFTKGKPVEIAGEMGEPDAWISQKDGEPRARCVVYAKTIDFMPGGKKKTEKNDQTATADNTESQTKKEETPAQALATTTPQEEQVSEMEMKERDDEDLPF